MCYGIGIHSQFPYLAPYLIPRIRSDLVFILLFPHLLLTMHFPTKVNRYGMVIGFTVCILLRVLSGEPVLYYEAPMRWPMYEVSFGYFFFFYL